MIEDLQYPVLGETNRLDQLGWHKAPKHKGARENVWYPCRRVTGDEGIGLVQKSSKGGKMLVRYLGYQSDTAGHSDEIKEREYVPLSEENRESGIDVYYRHLMKHFEGDLVRCKAEVLAVREMWRKVEERETASLAKAKASTKQVTISRSASSTAAENINLKRPLADGGKNSDEACSESDSDLDDTKEYSSSAKAPLRAGDVIEYYDPIGVAGKEQWRKETAIVGVAARDKFPLNLENGDLLDRTVRVKRLKRMHGKKMERCNDAAFKSIREYGLKSSGLMEMVALKAKVQRAKRIREVCDSQIEGFWKSTECKEGDAMTNSNETNVHQTNPQSIPQMAPEEIEVVQSAREFLQRKIDAQNNQLTAESIHRLLASKLRLQFETLHKVLRGEGEIVGDTEKMEVIKALKSWLADPCLNTEEHLSTTDTEALDRLSLKNEKNRRKSFPLAQRNQNTYIDTRKSPRTRRPR